MEAPMVLVLRRHGIGTGQDSMRLSLVSVRGIVHGIDVLGHGIQRNLL
jgi:hypothetical protein